MKKKERERLLREYMHEIVTFEQMVREIDRAVRRARREERKRLRSMRWDEKQQIWRDR